MNRFFILTILIGVTKFTNGQASKELANSTTKVINRLSYYWQKDSLAGNGFRLKSVNELLKSKLDTVSQEFLITKLGRPNQLRNTNHGIEYLYYYFDIKAMPKGYDAPMACAYISFQFKGNEKYVSEIMEGDMDR